MSKKCQDQIHVEKKPVQNQPNLSTKSKENVRKKSLVLVDIFSNQVGTSLSGGHNLSTALNNKKVKTQFKPSDSSDIEFDRESSQRNCIRGGLQNEFKFSGRGGVKRLHLKNKGKIDQSKFMRGKSNNQPRRITNIQNKFTNTQNKFENSLNKFTNTQNKFMGRKSNKLPRKITSAQSGPQGKFMRDKSNNLPRSIPNGPNQIHEWKKQQPTKKNNHLLGHYGETSDVSDDEIPDFENEPESNIFYLLIQRGLSMKPWSIHSRFCFGRSIPF